MHLLRLVKTNSAKISALSSINLVGMSVFYVASFDCNILISFKISTFSRNKNLKLDLEAQLSMTAITFGWNLYFTVALMTVSLIFFQVLGQFDEMVECEEDWLRY